MQRLTCLLLVLFLAAATRAQQALDARQAAANTEKGALPSGFNGKAVTRGFEENKGQVRTTKGESAPNVRYRLVDGNTKIFLLERGIAYQFERSHWPEGFIELRDKASRTLMDEERYEELRREVRSEICRMDMQLEGADPHAAVTTEGRSRDHSNYFVSHGPGGMVPVSEVRSFTTVTYHDVYPGIDWVISVKREGIEYDFTVHPGADPSLIRMRYSHHEELWLDAQGNLVHGNRLGRFTERRPVSWQGDGIIATRFRLEGDVLAFDLDAYDPDRELRIDPPRIWGTYYGGDQNDDFAFAMSTLGNDVFVAGQMKSSGLSTVGNSVVIGGLDAMIVKFDRYGERLWATYYGGDGLDDFASCAAQGSSVYATGNTTSSDLQVTFGAEQLDYNDGGRDAMLVKFNAANGDFIWGTYFGGAGIDRGRACAVGADSSLYLAGTTYSTSAMAGAESGFLMHQAGYAGTDDASLGGDGYLARFNPDNGNRLWGTYFGGVKADQVFGCAVAPDGRVYIAGGTSSVSGIEENGYDGTVGGYDAYLAKFDPDGGFVWGTYYGGSGGDQGNACGIAPDGYVYMVGQTFSQDGITSSGVQTSSGGDADVFIVKFDPAGGPASRVWGRRFGGASAEDTKGCAVDADGHIHLSGTTTSSDSENIVIMPGAHQPGFGGGNGIADAFLAEFDGDGTQVAGTYYGGSATDEGRGCGVNAMGDLFLVGFTYTSNAGSPGAIADGNAFQDEMEVGADWYVAMFSDNVDCAGVPGGPGLPGAACDDGDDCTVFDLFEPDCQCIGTELVAGSLVGQQQLCVGDVTQYSPSGNNAQGVWSSSDEDVATVIDGSVTAVGPGNAVIYFTVCPGTFAQRGVTVTAPPDAGTDGALVVCASGSAESMFAQLGGSPDTGGSWSGPSTVTGGMYVPGTMDPGTYFYTVNAIIPCEGSDAAEVVVTESTTTTWYADTDGDSFGDLNSDLVACDPPQGYVLNATDCDDTDGTVWLDDLLYIDADGDGYDADIVSLCYGASIPDGYAATTSGPDCNDSDLSVWQEQNLYLDEDGDGYDAGSEVVCYGASIPGGYVPATNGTDCDDADDQVTGVGTPCDDEDPATCNDVIGSNCQCAGSDLVQFGGVSGDNTINEGAAAYYMYVPPIAGATYVWSSDPAVDFESGQNSAVVGISVPPGVWGNVVQLCCSVNVADCGQDTTLCMNLFVSDVVGLPDAASAGGAWFTLLPNPGDGLFQLVPVDGGGITGPLSYTVEDATGRVVVPQGRIAASTSVLMDMRPALPGVYLLRLVGEDGMQVLRAVVR